MSLYNITGWSGGGRRPLTYNLRAGQFRSMGGCNVFGSPSRTIINNNFGGGYGYGYDCGCSGDSGVPSWMQWCMGGGMVMNFLGQMMSAIFPGKDSKSADGKGGAKDGDHSADMSMLRPLVKDKYNISGPINGKYMAKDIDTKELHTFDSFEELQDFVTTNDTSDKQEVKPVVTDEMKKMAEALGITIETGTDGKPKYKVGDETFTDLPKAIEKANKNKTTKETKILTADADPTDKITELEGLYPGAKGKITFENGKFKFNNKEYNDPETLEAAIKAKYPNNATSASTDNTGNVTRTAASLQTKFKNGGIWYNLAKCYTKSGGGTVSNNELKAVWRKIKDANGINEYGSGVQYNSTNIPDKFTIPKTIKVGDQTYNLNETQLPQ